MKINDLVQSSYLNAKEHGFWEGTPNIPEKLMLIVSEVSEVLEEYRSNPHDLKAVHYRDDGKPCGAGPEIADIVIRVCSLCGYLGLDLEHLIAEKAEFNRSRPWKHNKSC